MKLVFSRPHWQTDRFTDSKSTLHFASSVLRIVWIWHIFCGPHLAPIICLTGIYTGLVVVKTYRQEFGFHVMLCLRIFLWFSEGSQYILWKIVYESVKRIFSGKRGVKEKIITTFIEKIIFSKTLAKQIIQIWYVGR